MRTWRTIVVYGIVLTVCAAVGAVLCRWQSSAVNGTMIEGLGYFFSLTNAFGLAVWRQLNEPPPKLLSAAKAAYLRRQFDQVRRTFVLQWLGCFVAGGVAVVCGRLLLKHESATPVLTFVGQIGYMALGTALTLLALIGLTFGALSKLARELPKQLEEEQRKTQLLTRISPVDQAGERLDSQALIR